MNPTELLERRALDAKSLDEAACVLTILLSEGYSVWTDGTLLNIRQLVARAGALSIHVYADEHPPPHFHVKSADVDAVFTIDDCSFIRGNIDGREKKLVRWWYERARPQLVLVWNTTRPANCTVGPSMNKRSNRSVNTDAQVRPCATRTRFLCAGYLQR